MPGILATQQDQGSKPPWANTKILSQKTLSQKIGLVGWLKVKALSSSPITKKKKKKKKEKKSSALGLALHPSGPPVFLENPLR
jgi:hypothetical protein